MSQNLVARYMRSGDNICINVSGGEKIYIIFTDSCILLHGHNAAAVVYIKAVQRSGHRIPSHSLGENTLSDYKHLWEILFLLWNGNHKCSKHQCKNTLRCMKTNRELYEHNNKPVSGWLNIDFFFPFTVHPLRSLWAWYSRTPALIPLPWMSL